MHHVASCQHNVSTVIFCVDRLGLRGSPTMDKPSLPGAPVLLLLTVASLHQMHIAGPQSPRQPCHKQGCMVAKLLRQRLQARRVLDHAYFEVDNRSERARYAHQQVCSCVRLCKSPHCCSVDDYKMNMPCQAVLCCAVLCCAVLCCAVLCCAVLCCAVACHAEQRAH